MVLSRRKYVLLQCTPSGEPAGIWTKKFVEVTARDCVGVDEPARLHNGTIMCLLTIVVITTIITLLAHLQGGFHGSDYSQRGTPSSGCRLALHSLALFLR